MIFSSIQFLTVFLPIFLIVYIVSLKLFKDRVTVPNIILFLGSFVFYFYSTHFYSFILIALVLINYFLALEINYFRKNETLRTLIFILSVIINAGVLVGYKISGNGSMVGVGFYTLYLISYMADVYTKKTKAEKNIVKVMTFSVLFTKLMQGPIARYANAQFALTKRNISITRFDRGLKLFVFGMAMKVCLADKLGTLWLELQKIGYDSISTPLAWLGALTYSLQLYFDFRGYSIMAMGLGDMIGIRMPSNFDEPYASKSITDFYRRWHMSLGNWFRDYIYIPLGGNRKGKLRSYINIFIVWLLTSFWHGVSAHYFIWGMSLCTLIIIEKLFLKKLLDKSKIISHIYIIFFITLSWVAFAIEDLTQLKMYFSRLFPFLFKMEAYNIQNEDFIRYFKTYAPLLLVSVIMCIPFVSKYLVTMRKKWWSGFLALILFVVSLYYVALGSNNPFMYLNF